jgi:hypothetical protein
VIKFASGKNHNPDALKRVIEYITRQEKTNICLTYGKDVNPESAYHEMPQSKIDFHKEDGIQYKHLIQSFADYDEITPETAYQIGTDFLRHPMFDGFQVLMAVHRDKEHLHIHYVINSVNSDTGRKWNQTKQDLYRLRDYSDTLCRQHNLVVIPATEKGKSLSDGEYRSVMKGASWKKELWLVVSHCIEHSVSRKDFIAKMNKIHYQVSWSDTRKYVTFTTPDGKKCRNNKLYPPEAFTKEAMEHTFTLNNRYENKKDLDDTFELLLQAAFLLSENEEKADAIYPLSQLEGEARNEAYEEQRKGCGYEPQR